MDYEKLKDLKKMEMPDEMRKRIIKNCETKIILETEERAMGEKTAQTKRRALAAAMSICFCLAAGTIAAGASGHFKNITNWLGTVTGTTYEHASGEISVQIFSHQNELTVLVTFLNPEQFPYKGMEYLGIDRYQILDASGNLVLKGEQTETAEIVNGEARINVPVDSLGKGNYQLVISSFVGESKGDQPLPVNGTWECQFSL